MVAPDRESCFEHLPSFSGAYRGHGVGAKNIMVCRVLECGRARCHLAGRNLSADIT